MKPIDTTLRRLCSQWVLALAWLAFGASLASAHEFKLDAVINTFVKIDRDEAHLIIRAPLFLFKDVRFPVRGNEIDVDQSATAVPRAVDALQHDITLFADGRQLAPATAIGRLSLPSDRAFDSYEDAAAHVARPTEPDTRIVIDQGYVDAHFVYRIASPTAVFSIRTTAAPELGDYLKLALRYIPPGETGRAMVITSRSGVVNLNPSPWSAASSFIALGIAHILTGFDHLLFLLCLVIPLRGWRQIVSVITIFTVAHSFTLLGSAFGLVPSGKWFPPFVETGIAASIVFMALENIVGVDIRRRMAITALFGLVHGFGFSYGLQENFQFAGDHLLVSLFAFNVGIEVGQVCVLALMLPALAFVTRFALTGRVGMIVMSALVAHTGWHWMLERYDELARYPWPRPGVAGLASFAWAIVGVIGLIGLFKWRSARRQDARALSVPPHSILARGGTD